MVDNNFYGKYSSQKSEMIISGYLVRKITPLLRMKQYFRHKFATRALWRIQYQLDLMRNQFKKKSAVLPDPALSGKPLVYSCSGCSNSAQMANYLALQLDKMGIAEMSCIVGVGGNVKSIVRTALSGRKIITIDGCSLACSRACLGNHSLHADHPFDLAKFGVNKKQHEVFDLQQANKVLALIKHKIILKNENESSIAWQN